MKNSYTSSNLPVFFAISSFLHVILIYLIFFGLPFKPSPLPEEQIIVFELLPVSAINNVKSKKVQKEETVLNDDAKNINKSQLADSADKKTQPPEEIKDKALDAIKPKAANLPDNKKNIKEEKKPTKPEEKEKNEEKKESSKKKKPNNKALDSLLKNLEKESEGKNEKSKKINRQKTDSTSNAFGNFDDSLPESLTNDELIKQQINNHWNKPIASSTENIIIRIELWLNKDGSIEKNDVKVINCPEYKNLLCKTVEDSVIRAIRNAFPLVNLRPEDYSTWQNINFTFDTLQR